jgi:hypothetical protein
MRLVMNRLSRCTVLLALLSLSHGVRASDTPSATIRVSSASPGSSIGDQLIEGRMRFRDSDYLLTLRGLERSASSRGVVYGLLRASDIGTIFKPTDVEGELRASSGVTIRFDPPLELSEGRLEVELSNRKTPKISHGHREGGVE